VRESSSKSAPGVRRAVRLNPLWIRRTHAWCGALFAPTILFFAATGVLQVYDLHKPQPDRGYQPPAALQLVASLHKDQVARVRPPPSAGRLKPVKPHKARDEDGGGGQGDERQSKPEARAPSLSQILLKAFVTAASATLAATTLVGLYLALQNRRDRLLALGLITAGIVVPLALLAV
jgi:hypothetical protein